MSEMLEQGRLACSIHPSKSGDVVAVLRDILGDPGNMTSKKVHTLALYLNGILNSGPEDNWLSTTI